MTPTRMYHQVDSTDPGVCRKRGCIAKAAHRYEDPKHAWNEFCNEHADEAEATLSSRAVPRAADPYQYRYR